MTELNNNITDEDRGGFQLLPIAVTTLFVFALLQTTSLSFKLSETSQRADAEIIEGLARRAEGSATITEILTWLFFAAIAVFLHIVNKERALRTWARGWPLLLLLVLIMLSISWSDVPDIAFRRVVKHLLLVVVLAGIVVGADSPRDILRLAVLCTGLIMAIDYASLALLPRVAFYHSGAFQGLHPHKNSAGVFSMITIFVWFSAARWSHGTCTRAILYSGTLLWFLFLIGTDSRTSIASTILAIMVIVPIRHFIREPRIAVVFCLGALFIVLLAVYLLVFFNFGFSDYVDFVEGERSTLSGRFTIWEFVYEIFLDHILLGAGYGSVWSAGNLAPAELYSDAPLTDFLLGLTHAHNGYLDILAALGIVGAAILLMLLASGLAMVIRAFQPVNLYRYGAPCAEIGGFILLAIVVGNMTKTTFLASNIVWSSFVVSYLVLCTLRLKDCPQDNPASTGAAATVPRLDPVSGTPKINR